MSALRNVSQPRLEYYWTSNRPYHSCFFLPQFSSFIQYYGRLGEMSMRVKEKMALFSIKELQSMEISRKDLEWDRDDPTSLLGNGESASVYRGTFRLPGQSEPTQVAVKLWSKELNESTSIGFLSKTETLRLVTVSIFFK